MSGSDATALQPPVPRPLSDMRCFCISPPKPKTQTARPDATKPSATSPPTPRPSESLVNDVRRTSHHLQTSTVRQVRWADESQPTPRSGAVSCTGLLSSTFLDQLATHAGTFPLMATELAELRQVTQRVQAVEKALATASTPHTADIGQAELQSARQALRTQVQRVQMVLQGHRKDVGQYFPNLSKVTHAGTCRADWKRLQRVLKSIDAVPDEVMEVKPPALTTHEHKAAAHWRDLCTHRQQVTQSLRAAQLTAEQGNWAQASQQLHEARQEIQALLTEARALTRSGAAFLLDRDEYAGLSAFLRETPSRLARLERFQDFIDQQPR